MIEREKIVLRLFNAYLFIMLVIPFNFVFMTTVKIGMNVYITDFLLVAILIAMPFHAIYRSKLIIFLFIMLILRVLWSIPFQDFVLVIREIRPMINIILVGAFLYILNSAYDFFDHFSKYAKILIVSYILISLIFVNTFWNPYFNLGTSPWFPELFRFEARGYPYTAIFFLYSFFIVKYFKEKTLGNLIFFLLSFVMILLNGSRMLLIIALFTFMLYIYKHYSTKMKLMISVALFYIVPILVTSFIYLIFDDRGSTGRRFDEYNMVFEYFDLSMINLFYGLDFGFLYPDFYRADSGEVESVTFIHNAYLMMISKAGLVFSLIFLGSLLVNYFRVLTPWIKESSSSFVHDFTVIYVSGVLILAFSTYTFFQINDLSLLISFSLILYILENRNVIDAYS